MTRRRLRIVDKGMLVVLLPVLYQALLLGLLIQRQQEHTTAQKWAMHSKEVLRKVDGIYTLLVESQSALRGYALSDNTTSGQIAEETAAQIQPALADLHEFVRDNPAQQEKLASLDGDVNARTQWHRTVYDMIKNGDRAGALERFQAMEGQTLMDSVRKKIDAFRETEVRLDEERFESLTPVHPSAKVAPHRRPYSQYRRRRRRRDHIRPEYHQSHRHSHSECATAGPRRDARAAHAGGTMKSTISTALFTASLRACERRTKRKRFSRPRWKSRMAS